jgi:hypothetical protein
MLDVLAMDETLHGSPSMLFGSDRMPFCSSHLKVKDEPLLLPKYV